MIRRRRAPLLIWADCLNGLAEALTIRLALRAQPKGKRFGETGSTLDLVSSPCYGNRVGWLRRAQRNGRAATMHPARLGVVCSREGFAAHRACGTHPFARHRPMLGLNGNPDHPMSPRACPRASQSRFMAATGRGRNVSHLTQEVGAPVWGRVAVSDRPKTVPSLSCRVSESDRPAPPPSALRIRIHEDVVCLAMPGYHRPPGPHRVERLRFRRTAH